MRKSSQNESFEQPSALRQEVHQAAIAAARITGWAALNRPALVAEFKGRAGRSTLYRWLAEIDGAPLERSVGEMILDARAGGRPRVESVTEEIQARAAAAFPKVPTIGECVAATTPLAVMEKLATCLAAAQDVMSRSRDAAGVVRNGKMLLAASEHLRRSLETAVKLQEAITDGLEVEQFHASIMEEIAAIDPVVAGRIAARLLEMNAAWAGRADVKGGRT
jgi:hypothetical protein